MSRHRPNYWSERCQAAGELSLWGGNETIRVRENYLQSLGGFQQSSYIYYKNKLYISSVGQLDKENQKGRYILQNFKELFCRIYLPFWFSLSNYLQSSAVVGE
jgi:hypothetical protein